MLLHGSGARVSDVAGPPSHPAFARSTASWLYAPRAARRVRHRRRLIAISGRGLSSAYTGGSRTSATRVVSATLFQARAIAIQRSRQSWFVRSGNTIKVLADSLGTKVQLGKIVDLAQRYGVTLSTVATPTGRDTTIVVRLAWPDHGDGDRRARSSSTKARRRTPSASRGWATRAPGDANHARSASAYQTTPSPRPARLDARGASRRAAWSSPSARSPWSPRPRTSSRS